jgi:hypothetical protein
VLTCVAACAATATSCVPGAGAPALPAALATHGAAHRGQGGGGGPAAARSRATAAAGATKGNHGAGADEPAVATGCPCAAAAPAYTHGVGGAGADRDVVGPHQTTTCSGQQQWYKCEREVWQAGLLRVNNSPVAMKAQPGYSLFRAACTPQPSCCCCCLHRDTSANMSDQVNLSENMLSCLRGPVLANLPDVSLRWCYNGKQSTIMRSSHQRKTMHATATVGCLQWLLMPCSPPPPAAPPGWPDPREGM